MTTRYRKSHAMWLTLAIIILYALYQTVRVVAILVVAPSS